MELNFEDVLSQAASVISVMRQELQKIFIICSFPTE